MNQRGSRHRKEGMDIRDVTIKTRGALNPELRTCYEYDKLLALSHLSLHSVIPDARSGTLTLNQINSLIITCKWDILCDCNKMNVLIF